MRSLFALMDVALEAPDHTTLSRRSKQMLVDLRCVGRGEPVHLVIDSKGGVDLETPATVARSGSHDPACTEGRARRWKKKSGYHRQGAVENAFFRYKLIIGDRLRARSSDAQVVEATLACVILNRMAALGRPDSVAIRL